MINVAEGAQGVLGRGEHAGIAGRKVAKVEAKLPA